MSMHRTLFMGAAIVAMVCGIQQLGMAGPTPTKFNVVEQANINESVVPALAGPFSADAKDYFAIKTANPDEYTVFGKLRSDVEVANLTNLRFLRQQALLPTSEETLAKDAQCGLYNKEQTKGGWVTCTFTMLSESMSPPKISDKIQAPLEVQKIPELTPPQPDPGPQWKVIDPNANVSLQGVTGPNTNTNVLATVEQSALKVSAPVQKNLLAGGGAQQQAMDLPLAPKLYFASGTDVSPKSTLEVLLSNTLDANQNKVPDAVETIEIQDKVSLETVPDIQKVNAEGSESGAGTEGSGTDATPATETAAEGTGTCSLVPLAAPNAGWILILAGMVPLLARRRK